MTPEEFKGFLQGLLIASFICEQRAGPTRASHNAMAIMAYRTTSELAGRVPDWRPS